MGFPLPSELLALVCVHLFPEDLDFLEYCPYFPESPDKDDLVSRIEIQSFRLVCKAFAAAGSPSLTMTAYLSPYRYSLKVLTDISQHPCVSKYIRNMICDDSHLKMEAVINRPDVNSREYYKKMCAEQSNIRRQGEDLAVLCAALAKSPNLRSIFVTDNCNSLEEYDSTPVSRSGSLDHGILRC